MKYLIEINLPSSEHDANNGYFLWNLTYLIAFE